MMHLACIAEGRFLRHAAAMLHSALTHTAGPVTVHVLRETPIEAADAERLRATLAPFGAALAVHVVPESALAEFPTGYFPRAVWLRVLLPELLPDADRALYLDSDTIVTEDLRPLWQADLQGAWLGAIANPFYPFLAPEQRLRFGLAPAEYLNSGVLLMDLAAMRHAATGALFRAFARQQPELLYPDQDALNVVCRGRWQALHPRWNVQSPILELPPSQLPFPPAQVVEARARPAVLHFIGPFKPWHYLCRHPQQHLYFEHARATPWGEPQLEGRNLRNFVMRRVPLAWYGPIERAERWTRQQLDRLTGRAA